MDLFVYDPVNNTVEDRGEIVRSLGGEVRPLVVGPDGRIYGTGTRDNQVGLYIYDPVSKKVVKDFGAIGPKHPNGAWSRYVMAVDDTHAYIASGMIPAWYLVAINLETGEEKILLESPSEKVMDILEDFPSGYARVPQESGGDKEFWLYHGEAIPKTNDHRPWPKKDSPWSKAEQRPEVYFDQIDPDEKGRATVWYRQRKGPTIGGWFDPKTSKLDGIWQPLSGYAVQWITPVSDARLIVISTIRAPDELNNNRAPDDAKLFVFDVAAQKIVREIVPARKLRTTGLIKEAAPGRLLGLTISGSEYGKPGAGLLYGVDLETGAALFTKPLPWPVSIDDYWPHWVDPSYEYLDLVPGPDRFFWTFLKNVLLRIDPKDASVHVVGKIDPVGFPTFVGRDLYFSGPEQLRRIRGVAGGP
jgi:hypothetical protein